MNQINPLIKRIKVQAFTEFKAAELMGKLHDRLKDIR